MMTNSRRERSQAPADADARARVLDPLQSFIVQAPAGSGKTELLMQRYLMLLGHASVEQPESVLAITFTKKAAGEMRSRILQALDQAGGPEPQEAHKRLTYGLAKVAAERDRALGWDILRNPSRLQIRTVDSFCDQIARHTPLLAGLGPAPAIAADFRPLYREAAERTLRMIADADVRNAEAVAQVLRDQDNDLWRVSELLIQLLDKRDQWLRILGRSDAHSPEQLASIRETLEASLAAAVQYELTKIREAFLALPADALHTLLAYARFAASNVDPDHLVAPLGTTTGLPEAVPGELPKWLALRSFCLTSNGDFRSTYNKRDGFPPIAREYRDQCIEFVKGLSQSPHAGRLRAALCRVGEIPPSRYSDAQWASLAALFRVLPLAVAQLRVVFAERSAIDYIEVSQAALNAMGSDDHPTDLALSLGYRIQHVLMDEFQDTSVSQLRLLERLVRVWTGEHGATLFVVGDPMQSIYAFRQAEVTLFDQVRQQGVAGWNLEGQNLAANFRSVPELVSWFNAAFSQILTENNTVTGAVRHIPSVASQPRANEPAAKFHSAAPKDYSAEAGIVLDIVRKELEAGTGSIAVLVRSRTHLTSIVPELRKAGIRFRSKEIDLLGERQTVRDLHAITRAALHPGDRIAWLAVLRAPCCGLTLADLWELCRGDSTSSVWQLLQKRRQSLSKRAQQVLDRALPVLQSAMEQRGRRTLRSLVESTWISLGGYAALTPTDRDASERDAGAYLDLLQKVEQAGELADESRLVDGLQSLYAPPDTSAAVRLEVMTIHGAKGLEFDTVILPGLNRATDRNRKQLLNWRERILGGYDGLLLAPLEPVGAKSKCATIAEYIQTLANDSSAEEGKRLLYVAATRARRHLHLVTTLPEPDREPCHGSFLSYLWQVPEVAPFPAAQPTLWAEASPERIPQVLHRLPANWSVAVAVSTPILQPGLAITAESEPPQHTFDWVQENMRRIGTTTHRMLQQIGRDGVDHWTPERIRESTGAIRALLLHEGVPQTELEGTTRQVINALLQTVQDRHGRWLLAVHADARSELELSGSVGGTVVRVKLDRTFVDADGVRWIVDYKTTSIEGGARDQYIEEQVKKYTPDLQRYARVLRQYEDRPLRAGLYFPLMATWREVDLGRESQ